MCGASLRIGVAWLLCAGAVSAFQTHRLRFDRRQTDNSSSSFDWYSLTPSDNITWSPCYNGQQCARLNLPLDYSTPDGPTTQLALQMVPASDKANYQGVVLINDGGPGGASTQLLTSSSALLISIVGPTYDIVAFDPRGIGASLPLAQCFSSVEEMDTWANTEDLVVRNNVTLTLGRARDQVLAALCAQKLGGNGTEAVGGSAADWGPARFMDTASVATDMLKITETLGQEKLNYWGISYGTVLGQYFAAMYPDKVGRMIIDGVMDGMAWQRGDPISSIKDADAVMNQFFIFCSKAGPSKCALWEETAEKVSQRAERIMASLEKEPIAVPNAITGPAVLTADTVYLNIMNDLYYPVAYWPSMASFFLAIEQRNTTVLSQIAYTLSNVGVQPWFQTTQALQVVACSDYPPFNSSLAEDAAEIQRSINLTRWAGGGVLPRLRVTCGGWTIRAKNRYTGPVSADLNVPVLVASNRYDPVTPLSSAEAVVSRFKGARLLIQETSGHCASLQISNCAATAMRTYMMHGILPEPGTVCQPDFLPLIDAPPGAGATTASGPSS